MEADEKNSQTGSKAFARLLALSDGIFAFAITLLILDIVLPASTTKAGLAQALMALWPKYTAFLISFLVIGSYWIFHVRQFRLIIKYNSTLLWLNLLFLMFIVLMPFSTSVLSDFMCFDSVALYATNIACAGFTFTGIWIYVTRKRLVSASVGPAQVKRGIIMNLIAPVIFTLSTGLAYFNASLAAYSWILIFFVRRALTLILKLPKTDDDIR